ncbi:MAG: hypothetical protein ACKO86_12285 [Dolichospermum sp.]
MTKELLKQVRVIDPVQKTDIVADVLIIDGYIQDVAPQITKITTDTSVRDCQFFAQDQLLLLVLIVLLS